MPLACLGLPKIIPVSSFWLCVGRLAYRGTNLHSTTFIESAESIARLAYDIASFATAYAAQYAPAGAARDALATTSPDYFAYDWNLNTQ